MLMQQFLKLNDVGKMRILKMLIRKQIKIIDTSDIQDFKLRQNYGKNNGQIEPYKTSHSQRNYHTKPYYLGKKIES